MATRYKGKPAEVRALNAFINLMRATDSVRARLEPHLTRHGVTPTQFGVLEALYHLGPMNQRDLGRKLLSSKGNITTVVDNLEKRRFVKRTSIARDRRQSIVRLTSTGRRMIASMFPKQVRAITEDFSILTTREQEALTQLCKKLGRREKKPR